MLNRFATLAATLVVGLLASGCGGDREPGVERRLRLREAGVPIRCGEKTAHFITHEGVDRDWYGFRQTPRTRCSLELPVPPGSRLSFRAALAAKERSSEHAAHVALYSEVEGVETAQFSGALTAETPYAETTVDLPQGVVTLSFVVGPSTRGGKAGAVLWGELVITTRGPAADDGLPWIVAPEEALEPFLSAQAPPSAGGHPRLLIVGADGASWQTMQRLLDRGDMPRLAALRERSRWGVLRSTVVPESAMGWTAMRTGVNAGKSAGYSFFWPPSLRRSFWELLGDRGLTSVVVGVPTTSSAFPMRGVLISGWAPHPGPHWAQPPELHPLLERAGYRPDIANLRNPRYFTARMQARTELVTALLRGMDWDLAFVVYEYTDTVGHRFGLMTDEWDAVYRSFDAQLGQLLELVDSRTAVMLVSDHGWKRYPVSVDLDVWLQQQGFKGWTVGPPSSGTVLTITREELGRTLPPPDRSAHAGVLARIRAGLEALELPRDHVKVLKRVVDSETAFSGRFADRTPGYLIVEADERFRLRYHEQSSGVFGGPLDHHSHQGIYLLAAPGVEPGEGPEASIVDIAPTVLARFGLAPPDDFDGHSLLEAAELEPLNVPLYHGGIDAVNPTADPDVDPEFEEDLRTLGYIE